MAIGSAGGYGDFLGTLSKLKELSRTLEKKLGLKIVSGDRAPDSKTRAADRNEFEEARRLGTDLGHIRNTISDCLHRSNRGTAFKVALTAHGLTLANGDRRDCFVVVDQAGGHHALTKKLTGLTLAEIRQRLCDLDRAQLPGVDQAKAIQNRRHRSRDFSRASSAITETAREAAQTPKRETAPSHPKK